MPKKITITKGSGNVFADAGLPDAEELLIKAEIVRKITNIIRDEGFTQEEAAQKLGIDQPKVSALTKGKLAGFSLERLFGFLNKLGQDVTINIKNKPKLQKFGFTHILSNADTIISKR